MLRFAVFSFGAVRMIWMGARLKMNEEVDALESRD
jgi:hypothetical protein